MPGGNLSRNFNLCFAKIKPPPPAKPPESSLQQQDHNRPFSNSATSIVMKNFNSLYDFAFECTTSGKSIAASTSDELSSSDSQSDETAATPDFTSVYASNRFFCSSPGRSNSIIDSSSSIASTSSSPADLPESENLVGESIAVPKYSPDPFVDFRRSMQEMVEANDLVDTDYLHELLMCYLSLNPKSTHKFIVGAFADLLVSLMTLPPVEDGRRKSTSSVDGGRKISRRRYAEKFSQHFRFK